MSRILLLVISLLAFKSEACSFAPAFDDFVISQSTLVVASKPNFSVASIHRGTDDGNHGSCSDAGFIELKLGVTPSNEQGYVFKIVEGNFEDQLFNESPVVPSKFMDDKNSIVSFG
jgi:hypothetical protein